MSDFENIDKANAAYDHLKALYRSSKITVDDLVAEIKRLNEDNILLNAKLENCNKSNEIVKTTMRIAIEDFNKRIQDYITEIQNLREKLNTSRQS